MCTSHVVVNTPFIEINHFKEIVVQCTYNPLGYLNLCYVGYE